MYPAHDIPQKLCNTGGGGGGGGGLQFPATQITTQ